MKSILPCLFALASFNSAQAATTRTLSGEEIQINGLPVSARLYWNFDESRVSAEDLFCMTIERNLDARASVGALYRRVAPRRMAFFTSGAFGWSPVYKIIEKEEESLQLEQVTCRTP